MTNKKRMRVRKLFAERESKGEFHLLISDLKLFDHEYFFKYFRMSPTRYEELLRLVAPRIIKSNERRTPIGPSERLCVTLKYLVTGDAQCTIAASFRISPTAVGRIIKETSEALWDALLEHEFLKIPQTEEHWLQISEDFKRKWNFPRCLGAIDGKHVVMQAPPRSGSSFFNYKRTHSIVVLAVCDARYSFTLIDVGDSGRNSDGGVFSSSKLGFAITNNHLNIPHPKLPYVFVGDKAFQLTEFMMKPYPREILDIKNRIFNYRLSPRARRIIENTFGIAAARFRIFRRPIIARVDVVVNVTKAVVALHNFLMSGKMFDNDFYCPPGFSDVENEHGLRFGDWRKEIGDMHGLSPIQQLGSNNYKKDAKLIREHFRDFFCSMEGEVPWQWDIIVTSTRNVFDN